MREVLGSGARAVTPDSIRATIDELELDPENPRLPEGHGATTQEALIRLMASDYALLELARSFVDNGYFEEEPLVAVRGEGDHYIVKEGNRRLATLKLLQDPSLILSLRLDSEWIDLSGQWQQRQNVKVPVLVYKRPEDVTPFLGFRHISGAKPWEPPEKARFINSLVEMGMHRFVDISREVGSPVSNVRDSYVAYRVLTQAREFELDTTGLERDFGVFLRALSSPGVRSFLGIDTRGREPLDLSHPVLSENKDRLGEFLIWLFGTKEQPKVVKDSREITKFGQVLSNQEALETLRASDSLATAVDALKSGEESVLESLRRASFQLDEAKRGIDRHAENARVRELVARCRRSVETLVKIIDLQS